MAHTLLQISIWRPVKEGRSQRDSKSLNVLSSSEVETSCVKLSPNGCIPRGIEGKYLKLETYSLDKLHHFSFLKPINKLIFIGKMNIITLN